MIPSKGSSPTSHDSTLLSVASSSGLLRIAILLEQLPSTYLGERGSNLEINGVPEESAENLVSLVTQIANTVRCEITNDAITHVTRVAKQSKEANRPRSIIVKLKSRTLRDSLLSATMKFNKTQDPKLNSHHLGYGGKQMPVYISEHLSPANKTLHAAARRRAKETGYRFVWIKDGRIYARKDEKSPAVYIRDHENLALLS
ncbi:uncharacterized protein LOC142985924 [Anticarsia gemmatalis]|uniref:uncharacterized protein LOC142985924 n=1 Tax=Anticarsia gemmatalis TaxID=129554 RepID=UPI003F76B427